MQDVLDRLDSISACLKEWPQWVCWKFVDRNGRLTKFPISPRCGFSASSTDPSTWSDFATAVDFLKRNPDCDGIGFVFLEDDPFCGIDLDDCLDEDGQHLWGKDLVAWLGSYTEVSPSGRGLKIILRGRKPDFAGSVKRNEDEADIGHVEVYDSRRFFTVTGTHLDGTQHDVIERQEELHALCEHFWQPKAAPDVVNDAPAEDRIEQCLESMLRISVVDRRDGSMRLFTACCRCVEHDLSDAEAIVAIRQYAQTRPFPKEWTDAEIIKRLRSAELKCQRGLEVVRGPEVDLSGIYKQAGRRIDAPESVQPNLFAGSDVPKPAMHSVVELVEIYPQMRRPVIYGLLREGETMNVIASPKTGKSWLTLDLAISVATGLPWLGRFETEAGKVLIIDNELHRETCAHRLPKVAEARDVNLELLKDRVYVDNLRGRLQDIFRFSAYFEALAQHKFKVIILDAFYRFMPAGGDENDNGTMANIYNLIDSFAERLDCCFILIHHSTKGSQSGKSVTDMGAGAGAQSRATDTHLVLRPHEEPKTVVLDAAVRSWPPIDPVCLKWSFPVWNVDESLDPELLKPDRPRRSRRPKAEAESKPPEPEWNVERFVDEFINEDPKSLGAIYELARQSGISERRAKNFLQEAEHSERAFRWKYGANLPVAISRLRQQEIESNDHKS